MSIRNIFGMSEEKAHAEAEKRDQQFARDGQMLELGAQQERDFTNEPLRSDLVRWQQEMFDEVDMLIHDLRSEIQIDKEWVRQSFYTGVDEDGKEVYQEVPVLMNELGINRIKSYLKPLVSKNLINSNYSEDRIYVNLRGIIFTIILHLRDNFHYYDIRKQDLAWIIRQIKNISEPTMWRCWNNGERKYLTTIHKHIEARNETNQNQPKNTGFFRGVSS